MRSGTGRIILCEKTAMAIFRCGSSKIGLRPYRGACIVEEAIPQAPSIEELSRELRDAIPEMNDGPLHVLLSNRSKSNCSSRVVTHVTSSELPRKSLVRLVRNSDRGDEMPVLSPGSEEDNMLSHGRARGGERAFLEGCDVFVCVPELSLIQLTWGVPDMARLLMILWEACGTYRTFLTGFDDANDVRPAMSVRSLKRFLENVRCVQGTSKLVKALPFLRDGSASVRETQLALLLGLPMRQGGYGLGIPEMNRTVEADQTARRIGGKKSFRCDLCWPGRKVDVEYQSTRFHADPASLANDSRRTKALISMGWTVVTVTNREIGSPIVMDGVAESVRKLMKVKPREKPAGYTMRKMRLREALGI